MDKHEHVFERFIEFESYLGYMRHCDCIAFRKKLLDDFVLVRHYAEDQHNNCPDE